MVAAPTQLPELSALDRAILTRFFELDSSSLRDLLDSLTRDPVPGAPETLFDLYAWAARDGIRPWIDLHESQETDRLKRCQLARLESIAATAANPVEVRRAATTILRILCIPARPAPRNQRPPQPARVPDEPAPPAQPPHAAARQSAAPGPVAPPTTPNHAAPPTTVRPDHLLNSQPRAESPINRLARLAGHNPHLTPSTGWA